MKAPIGPRTAGDPGPKPELKWLPVDELSVDHRYQRTLESDRSKQLVNRIAERFRWCAFQAILATERDGGAWLVLDGQHRVEAARRNQIPRVPAVVVSAVSIEEQAQAFVQANLDRVALNPYALYHARLVAGEERARMVERICVAARISIPKYPIQSTQLPPGATLALGSIEQLAKKHGEAVATAALKAIAVPYREYPGAIRASLIRAIGKLLDPAVGLPPRRELLAAVSEWLGRTKPLDLWARVSRRKETRGGSEFECTAAVIRLGALAGPKPPAINGDSFIKAPTRAQLMGTR